MVAPFGRLRRPYARARCDARGPSPKRRAALGGRLCAQLLSAYWREVQAAAGLRFDFYLATKHKCVHFFKVKLGLPNHVIAAQMGWSESAVEKMVATYAHADIGALDAIVAAFEAVPDPTPTQAAAEALS